VNRTKIALSLPILLGWFEGIINDNDYHLQ